MLNFQIRQGLATELFLTKADGTIDYENCNPNVALLDGYWYLCTDTAELFLCTQVDNQAKLKRINNDPISSIAPSDETSVIKVELNASREILIYYSDDTFVNLGPIDIPTDLSGYATKSFVEAEIAKLDIKDVDLSDYATKAEIPTNISSLINDAGYITQVDIPKFDLTAYALKEELPIVPDKISAFENDKGYLTEHQDLGDYAKKTEVPSIVGLATEEFVLQKIADAELTAEDVDLSAYYTKNEINDLLPDTTKFLTEIPGEYITESELETKGYLTEHLDLSEYAKRSELPSTKGLATELFVQEQIEGIEFPEPDLTDYYNKTETTNVIAEAIVGKANAVLFNSDNLVTNPVGNFTIGENIKGLTLTEILAKLLGLSEDIGELPDEPETPVNLVDQIIADELSMYAVTDAGNIISVPFKHITMTQAEAELPCTEAGFYQIKDDSGNVVESGYQEIQANSSDIYYVIALPKEIDYDTMVTIKTYDIRQNMWVNAEKFKMVSDPAKVAELCEEVDIDISSIDQTNYTILVWEDLPSGSLLRYIINE